MKLKKYVPMYYNGELTKYLIDKKGHIISINYKRLGKAKRMKQFIRKDGYYDVNISVNKKLHRILVHRLVAENFLGLPENYKDLVVNHKNGNRADNRVKNLEWCTYSENTVHAIKSGFRKYSSFEHNTVDKKTVKKICKLLEKNELTMDEIAEKVGSTYGVVYNIKYGLTYPKISKKYKIENHNTYKKRTDYTHNESSPRLTEDEVISIADDLINTKMTIKEIAEKYGISRSKVEAIRYKTAWADILSDYDFSVRDKNKPRRYKKGKEK